MEKVFTGKPCFCGHMPNVYAGWTDNNLIPKGFFVMCPKCGARTEIKGTKISAVNKWNGRVVYIPSLKTRLMRKIAELKQQRLICEQYVLFTHK